MSLAFVNFCGIFKTWLYINKYRDDPVLFYCGIMFTHIKFLSGNRNFQPCSKVIHSSTGHTCFIL